MTDNFYHFSWKQIPVNYYTCVPCANYRRDASAKIIRQTELKLEIVLQAHSADWPQRLTDVL